MTFRLKRAVDAAAIPLYRLRGGRPWTAGYHTTKQRAIEAAIDADAVSVGRELPPQFGVALDERVVEYAWVFSHLRRSGPIGRLLDAGSIFNHDYLLRRTPLRGSDLTIMTLAPEKHCFWHRGISYVFGDLRDTYFKDAAFDTIVCISTIEHVGLDNSLLYSSKNERDERDERGFIAAAREFRRIIKPGGVCYISFPYGARLNLGWYQVFDGPMIDQIVEAFAPSEHSVEYFGYAREGWRRASAAEVEHSVPFDVHSGSGKGDDRAASSRAIACLRLLT
ncbi:class I SAM-dependent methyltransferase [Bradyrhizobium yuanmingense]|uniref:class I SAM-dependent methyltransferase n=1 Tax=Bradyrhizobium yuanmingense TaxID=108015 RepID=UPI0023B99CE9|nr:methyltransferase domain-containing protein [Bradyrhizobium yuanmingense]MDF0583801.1 methyltransferase domain-containing protein [Bradyrhizobium yuanmingense]